MAINKYVSFKNCIRRKPGMQGEKIANIVEELTSGAVVGSGTRRYRGIHARQAPGRATPHAKKNGTRENKTYVASSREALPIA